MKGKHKIIVSNNRLHYEFVIKRNITVIQGDSATGKTTLINMIRQHMNLGISSGVDVISDVPCRILEGTDWEVILQNITNHIIFMDEENAFVNTEQFASAVKRSNNYFVIITRENLYNLPYSVEEIYGLHSSGKYQNTKKVYQEMYQMYPIQRNLPVKPCSLLVEDTNAGYEFFKAICDEKNIQCISAGGNSNISSQLMELRGKKVCVIVDGAAFGAHMNVLAKIVEDNENITIYLPESFEWIVLKSGVIPDKELKSILNNPEDAIDSMEFFSWERYFTHLLISKTEGTYMQYKKAKLNSAYLAEKVKMKIITSIEGIKFS